MNRKELITKNSIASVSAQLITIIATFVVRKILIQYIGIEYLGLNTVLLDVLNMLSLSELGVQTAIVFRLYKPLAYDDKEKINEIILLLKKIYRIVSLIIFCAGVGFLPFAKKVIKDVSISEQTIYISFFILLISICSSYLLSYKRALLYADQKQYVISIVEGGITFLCSIMRIISIIVGRSFYLYLSVSIIQNIFSNLLLEIYCKKRYTWLSTKGAVSTLLKKNIYADIKNVFAGKLAGFIYGSTDNLLISSIISTVAVGYVGNYKSVTNVAKIVMSYMFLPMQPMIGNYLETEDKKSAYTLFDKYSFVRYVTACISLIPLLLFTQGIIKEWIGEEYLLEWIIVCFISVDLYFSCIQGPAGEYIIALGWFRYDRNINLLGTVANIFVSLVLINSLGIKGVLIGTIISQIVMWAGKECIVLVNFFQFSYKRLLKDLGKEGIRMFLFWVIFMSCNVILKYVDVPGNIFGLVLQFVIAEMLIILLIFLFYIRSNQGKFILEIIKNLKGILVSITVR